MTSWMCYLAIVDYNKELNETIKNLKFQVVICLCLLLTNRIAYFWLVPHYIAMNYSNRKCLDTSDKLRQKQIDTEKDYRNFIKMNDNDKKQFMEKK